MVYIREIKILSDNRKNILIHFLYSLCNIPRTYATYGRISPFKKFKNNYLKCTKKYTTFTELKNKPPRADIYIAGSDQIWNSILPNGKDPAFFLNFGDKSIKRISYAASFGISLIPDNVKDTTKQYLSFLDDISVREITGVKLLSELGYNSTVVLDPVFLLNTNEWEILARSIKHVINHKYILVYDIFQDNNNLISAAQDLSKKYGLEIVSINDAKKSHYAHHNISNGGPIEFLNLIYNAEFVISCSFHATAFALIFHKKFLVFYQKNNISRMQDLLKSVELEECLNPKSIDFNKYNWNKINDLLNEKISLSKKFILHAISEKKII